MPPMHPAVAAKRNPPCHPDVWPKLVVDDGDDDMERRHLMRTPERVALHSNYENIRKGPKAA